MQVLKALTALLICKTTLMVVLGYVDYFPANFDSDFLRGREDYFYGWYCVPFYVHIVAGPTALLLGLLLMSQAFLKRLPAWHRWVGKIQVINVIFLLAPSGLGMALYSATGMIAGAGFALLAIATAFCAGMGWRTAMNRQFQHHRRWMLRCFALLCSAVVLRMIGGLTDVLGAGDIYAVSAWISWLLPLLGVELFLLGGVLSRSYLREKFNHFGVR